MLKTTKLTFAILWIGILGAGCGSTIKVTDSWIDANREGQRVQSIMVLGVAKETTSRRMFEDEFVQELQARGVNAIVSYRLLNGELTKQMIDDAVTDAGVTTIMVTRSVDKKKETVYTPGTTTVYGGYPGYYGSYYGYYNHGYSAVSSPGYVSEWITYVLESNLYDIATEELIWTARTEIDDPSSIAKAVDALTVVLTRDMQSHGLIGK